MNANVDELASPRILIVDDDATQRDILTTWLRRSGYTPIAAESVLTALVIVQEEAVDVVVTDLRMPHIDGLQLLKIFEELHPATPVIFLSGEAAVEDAVSALRGGRAFDFLLKPLSDWRVLNASIEAALAWRRGAVSDVRAAVMADAGGEAPTETEVRLLALLGQGYDNRRIADTLHFSEKTVRNYLSRVYEKLGVHSRLQAVTAARAAGLIE